VASVWLCNAHTRFTKLSLHPASRAVSWMLCPAIRKITMRSCTFVFALRPV
jgi:hypothetical protein